MDGNLGAKIKTQILINPKANANSAIQFKLSGILIFFEYKNTPMIKK